jgi:organic radical activating enzyme
MEKDKIIMLHLGILVTTYCNLNCRNCADLIPKRENIHYPLADIKSDLRRVLDAVEYIEEVLVIGGETLLYPELKEVLDFCAEQPKIGQLIITTNGVIKPAEEMLENLKKNDVLVRISGYPEFVTPNRKETVSVYQNHAIKIEDMENMVWYSMGDENKRGRTKQELEDVFRTCSMKDCVTMNHEGKIFFCSRQMSAYETRMYPNPEKQEYIDVRNDSDLTASLSAFYELPYISTCDYCDGISCATAKPVGTATQILDKKDFLELLGCYEVLKNIQSQEEERQQAIMSVYGIVRTHKEKLYDLPECTNLIEALPKVVSNETPEAYNNLLAGLRELVDTLTRDYNFAISENVPVADTGCKKGFPNLIRVGMYGVDADADADILLTEEDIAGALLK